MNLLKNTAGIKVARKYESDVTFPPIAWGDVAQQCRNFTKVGQKTIVIAHAPSTITQALNAKGFGVRIRRTDIPYHFEVEIMEKNRFTLTAKA